MLYFFAFLFVALAASVLVFRLVALAAAEIARVFLFLFVVVSPVNAFFFLARRTHPSKSLPYGKSVHTIGGSVR